MQHWSRWNAIRELKKRVRLALRILLHGEAKNSTIFLPRDRDSRSRWRRDENL